MSPDQCLEERLIHLGRLERMSESQRLAGLEPGLTQLVEY